MYHKAIKRTETLVNIDKTLFHNRCLVKNQTASSLKQQLPLIGGFFLLYDYNEGCIWDIIYSGHKNIGR